MSHQAIAVLAVLLFSTGCAGRYDSQAETSAEADSIYIDTLNENFYDARVHAVYTGGQRRSLGTIVGNGGYTRTAVMWEPHALVFEISFIISGAQYVSQPLNVSRGEVVDLRLPANIDQSGFFRRVSRN
ncbi:MAG: hypothetical protein KFH98_15570 [Gemmatimonadetes bacterium]|nr:hypothetical protein [Gemmatimonadota bacterium]